MKVTKKNGATDISANTMSKLSQKFWDELVKMCLEVKAGNTTWVEVAEFAAQNGVNMTPDYVRQGCRILFGALDNGLTLNSAESSEKLAEGLSEAAQKIAHDALTNEDGSSSMEFLIDADRLEKLFEGKNLSEPKVREFFGIDNNLVITSMQYQIWHGAVKGGGKQMLYNLKVKLKPKTPMDITPKDFEEFFERNAATLPALPAIDKFTSIDESAATLHIDVADIHFGLLAHKPETGENYDLKIARQHTLMCIRSIVDRYKSHNLKAITFATLGDILHVDNGDMTTTHGTKQDAEGRVPKMLDVAVATLVECIRMLEELQVPIKYVYVPGNHDANLGYAVALCVKAMLSNDPNVVFDITPSLFKAITYGCTIIGISHGEANNKRAHTDLINTHRREFGLSDYAEVHLGHLHSEAAKDEIGGVMIYRVPAVCESSYWEKGKGYPAIGRGIMAFEYDDYEGRVSVSYHTVKGIAARMAANKKKNR